jgi:hypothetical protein
VATPLFSAIAADSLAVSFAGCVPCLGTDKKRKWQFLPFSGGNPALCADSNGCFRFDSLPSGKGAVGYFTDANDNGRPDKGSLVPWIAPEPSRIFPDTIEARARWEIEGVTFNKPCEQCRAHQAAAVSAPVKKTDIKKKQSR